MISFAQINEYIMKLVETGLLEINYDDKSIKTSMKGIEFIRKFDFLTQQISVLKKSSSSSKS